MPARKNPVKNLNIRSEVRPSASKYILIFAKAPRIEHTKNTFLGENTSDIVKKAKQSVPVIKPNCTEEVTQPIEAGWRFQLTCRSEIIAFPANQSEVPANWEKIRTGSIQKGLLVKSLSYKSV